MDVDKLAIEAEADRLSGVYIRVMMLARAKRVDLSCRQAATQWPRG